MNQSAEVKERRLRQCLEKQDGATFLSYDHDRYVWMFRVDHFTKWGDDDESDEEINHEDDNSDVAIAQKQKQQSQL